MSEVAANTGRLDLVEASLDAQMAYLTLDEQQALGERLAGRFGWKMAGDLAVAESTVFSLDGDDYSLTVTALADLGIKNTRKQRIPEFDELDTAFSSRTAEYLSQHVERGDQPELMFNLPLDRKGFTGIIENFDKKQQYSTSVWEDLWDKLDHPANSPLSLTAAMLLNDKTDPFDRERKANNYDEAGLVHVGKTVKEQRDLLDAERQNADSQNIAIRPLSFSQYMIVQAKRRQAGLPLLDKQTFTRFVQYPDTNIDGNAYVPSAGVYDADRLRLSGSDVGYAWDNRGVRRGVRVA